MQEETLTRLGPETQYQEDNNKNRGQGSGHDGSELVGASRRSDTGSIGLNNS